MEEEWHTVTSKKRTKTSSEISTQDFRPLDIQVFHLLQKKKRKDESIGISAHDIAKVLSIDVAQVGDCLYDGPLSKYVVRDPPPGQHVKGKKPMWKLIV